MTESKRKPWVELRLFDVGDFGHDSLLLDFKSRADAIGSQIEALAFEFWQLAEVSSGDRTHATLSAVAKIHALAGELGLEALLMAAQRLSNAGR